MTKSEYIERLRERIQQLHHCDSIWIRTESVREEFQGKTFWEGVVEVFALIDHPKARWMYCWKKSDDLRCNEQFVLMLEHPPIECARDAVRMFLAQEKPGLVPPSKGA